MATLTNVPKHNAALTAQRKPHRGQVFYAWLFWFTRTSYFAQLTNVPKHNGVYQQSQNTSV